jgi:hypothetical protein
MLLQSLISEITGAVPHDDVKLVEAVAPNRRLIVIFEDTLGALRAWQNELLKIDGDRLREMHVAVACVPSDGQPTLLNGKPATLPVDELRDTLQGNAAGKFEVLLLDFDGRLLLRSEGPVTIGQLADAVKNLGGQQHV